MMKAEIVNVTPTKKQSEKAEEQRQEFLKSRMKEVPQEVKENGEKKND